MLTVMEHTLKVRFPRLTTHFGSITLLFCADLAFWYGQNFVVSGLCALSGHSYTRRVISHHFCETGIPRP